MIYSRAWNRFGFWDRNTIDGLMSGKGMFLKIYHFEDIRKFWSMIGQVSFSFHILIFTYLIYIYIGKITTKIDLINLLRARPPFVLFQLVLYFDKWNVRQRRFFEDWPLQRYPQADQHHRLGSRLRPWQRNFSSQNRRFGHSIKRQKFASGKHRGSRFSAKRIWSRYETTSLIEISARWSTYLFSKIGKGDGKPYAIFENDTTGKVYTNFGDVRLNIEKLTDDVAGKGGMIVNDPIKLKIYSNDCPDLTIIDLPGITRIDIKGQKDV